MQKEVACFVHYPFRIEDLRKPHPFRAEKSYEIVKTIELAQIDYENLITDLTQWRDYLEKSVDGTGIIDDVYHCLLVKQKGKEYGVLIIPDKLNHFPLYAAYLP